MVVWVYKPEQGARDSQIAGDLSASHSSQGVSSGSVRNPLSKS